MIRGWDRSPRLVFCRSSRFDALDPGTPTLSVDVLDTNAAVLGLDVLNCDVAGRADLADVDAPGGKLLRRLLLDRLRQLVNLLEQSGIGGKPLLLQLLADYLAIIFVARILFQVRQARDLPGKEVLHAGIGILYGLTGR